MTNLIFIFQYLTLLLLLLFVLLIPISIDVTEIHNLFLNSQDKTVSIGNMNWRYLLRILVGSFWWPIISSISATNPSDSVNVLDSFDVANNLDIDEIIAARSNDKCGYYKSSLKNGDFGSIVTPNYPQNYPPRLECIWWLKVKVKY